MTKYKISFVIEGKELDHDNYYPGMSKKVINGIIKDNFSKDGNNTDDKCDVKLSKLNIERV